MKVDLPSISGAADLGGGAAMETPSLLNCNIRIASPEMKRVGNSFRLVLS